MPIILNDGQWANIEKAYGRALPSAVRSEIQIVTIAFTALAPGEKEAIPITPILKTLKKLKLAVLRAASNLPEFSEDKPPKQSRWTLEQIIKKYFQERTAHHQSDSVFGLLNHSINALTASIGLATNELLDHNYGHFDEGHAWDLWIQDLTTISKQHDLPYKIRKDWDKQAVLTPSPFVSFVSELQTCLPPSSRRHSGRAASIALTQAIYRARSKDDRADPTKTFGEALMQAMLDLEWNEKKPSNAQRKKINPA